MLSIKGHFDGNAIILDEPASLGIGQIVRIIVEPPQSKIDRLDEPWKGKVHLVKDVDGAIDRDWEDYYKSIAP